MADTPRRSSIKLPEPEEKRFCQIPVWQLAIKHIRHVRMAGDQNKMERFNGEVRDREKIVRGVKKADSPLLTGYQIYHNYIRPHMGLDGRTPAEKAGIKVVGQDRW